jgi:hypothetical protein
VGETTAMSCRRLSPDACGFGLATVVHDAPQAAAAGVAVAGKAAVTASSGAVWDKRAA